MHYWIDGYNLLFHLPKSRGSFEEKRRFLISQINKYVKQLSLHATVVFDASDPMQSADTRSHYDSLELIYTIPKK
jgi:predicted RNA-binding protein with PIN domain